MTKQLFRSNKSKMLGGVAGGLGEYFDVDPIIIRVIFVVSVFAWGLSLLVYIALWIFVPQNDDIVEDDFSYTNPDISDFPEVEILKDNSAQTHRRVIAGVVLIIFGMMIIIDKFVPSISLGHIWPLLLVGFGGYIIYKATQNRSRGGL